MIKFCMSESCLMIVSAVVMSVVIGATANIIINM